MKTQQRHSGFSLIEVLFAMMVLTMGLIFVASQFPIGLMISRQVTETTIHSIESHNGEVIAELRLSGMKDFGGMVGKSNAHFINDVLIPPGSIVHYWCQPNLRLSDGAIIIDDPTGAIYDIDPAPDVYYLLGATPGSSPKNIIPPYIKGHLFPGVGPTAPPVTPQFEKGILAPENIGQIVVPQVNSYDYEVVNVLGAANMPFNDTQTEYDNWQEVILNIALERSYSQAIFYQLMGSRRCQVWIFTLSNTNKEAAYAIQDISDDAFIDGEAIPEGDDATDRRFPFPWRVAFTDLYDLSNPTDYPVTDRIKLDYVNDDTNLGLMLDILRPDGFILDADNGVVYRIIDIEGVENPVGSGIFDDWLILDRPLQASLQWFWIFPPAIIRGVGFDEKQQPVVDVAKLTFNF